jgi:hypothetical protein
MSRQSKSHGHKKKKGGNDTSNVQDIVIDDDIQDILIPSEYIDRKKEDPESIEVEVRFSHKDYPITGRLFHSVREQIKHYFGLKEVESEESTVNYYKDFVRSINTGSKLYYERKVEENKVEHKDYPFKIALSKETIIKEKNIPKSDRIKPTRVVERTRYSYIVDDVVRYDFTFAKINDSTKEWTEYRIEMEILEGIEASILTRTYLLPLLKFVLESPILYTLVELNDIKNNPPFVYYRNNERTRLQIDKPEDLLFYDLKRDGLIANYDYMVTIKTDGIRKLFFIHKDSIYFVGVHGKYFSFSRI